jgi:hypothetical protein
MKKRTISILQKSLVFVVHMVVVFIFASCYRVNTVSSPNQQNLSENLQQTVGASKIHTLQPTLTPIISRSAPIADELATTSPTLTATSAWPTATIVAIMVAVTKIVPEPLRGYIGLKYTDLPDGLSSGFGALIIPEMKGEYALSGVHGDQLDMLWFEKRVFWYSNGKRQKGWEVLDILELAPLEGKDEVLIQDGCMLDQELDPEIMVIARLDEEADRTRFVSNVKIIRAWRLNRELELIEEISIENIECYADMAMKW